MTPITMQLALADLPAATGKLDAARLAFGKLEATYPDDPDVLLALGQFAVRAEDFSGARQYLDRAIHAGSCVSAACSMNTRSCCGNLGDQKPWLWRI